MMLARLTAILMLILCATHADAHSTVRSTSPASGAVLPVSPPKITIQFNEAARLATVLVIAGDGTERSLAFSPRSSAKEFTVAAPELAPGRNEVRWTALSKDGHPIKGSIILVIKPAKAGGP